MWSTHTPECDSSFKRKTILIHSTTWMNLGRHYAKCNKPVVTKGFHLHEVLRINKFIESRIEVTEAREMGNCESLIGTVSVLNDRKF